jgi:hypothetical protein
MTSHQRGSRILPIILLALIGVGGWNLLAPGATTPASGPASEPASAPAKGDQFSWKVVSGARYAVAAPYSDGLAGVVTPPLKGSADATQIGHIGVIDKTGEYVVKPEDGYKTAIEFHDGLGGASRTTNAGGGFLDKRGRLVITDSSYLWGGIFSDGLGAVVVKVPAHDDASGHTIDTVLWFVNNKGEVALKTEYTLGDFKMDIRFSDGLAPIKQGYIDKTGKLAITMAGEHGQFSEALACVQSGPGGKWGYIDKTGNQAIPPRFESAGNFSDGLAVVTTEGKKGYIDKSGTAVIRPQFDNARDFSEGLGVVQLNKKWGAVDKTGAMVIKAEFDGLDQFHGGLAPAQVNAKWGYIDKGGETIVPPQFDGAGVVSEGLASIAVGEKWGYIAIGPKAAEPVVVHKDPPKPTTDASKPAAAPDAPRPLGGEVKPGQPGLPGQAALAALAPYFMLGVTAGPGDRWVGEVRTQGAHFDIRYQYLAAGVNTPSNWRTWASPPGQFALNYFKECDHQGTVPCMTYYQMYQSLPCGAKGDEAQGNKTNCDNAETMKAYFEDMKILFQKCGEFNKTVIIHHEPDLWGYMSQNPAFAPNDPDKTKMMVKSSGFPEAAAFDDTVAGFGKCIAALRDKYAPKTLLAWHASKWGNPNPRNQAAFCVKSGRWDLVFTDPSDRDSGWKMSHLKQPESEAWWTEKTFASFRDWSGEIHRLTGLPLMAWQIPMGNTFMATCDDTEGHFMDNRVEYFLENYPANKHIAEWASVGYIGLLFGGGAGGCTDCRDGRKDGITNPEAIKNNKGEKATFPDDDGGYLRLRGANYYIKKPLPLPGTPNAPTSRPAAASTTQKAAAN